MAKTLVVYKDDKVIREEPKNPNGKTTVTISGLESNTDYAKGTFKISWKDDNGESDLVDVPAFKTLSPLSSLHSFQNLLFLCKSITMLP